jgi:hypothetical protein
MKETPKDWKDILYDSFKDKKGYVISDNKPDLKTEDTLEKAK